MQTSHKRKRVLLRKPKKIRVIRRISAKARKQARKHTPYKVIVRPITGEERITLRPGVRTQLYDRTAKRKTAKRKLLKGGKKLSKKNKQLYDYIKRHKAAVSSRYNTEMQIAMDAAGYLPSEIEWAVKYSIVGQAVQTAIVRVEQRVQWYKLSAKKRDGYFKRAIKATRIQSYMDILGITKKKAKEIYHIFEKHLPGEFILKALIY